MHNVHSVRSYVHNVHTVRSYEHSVHTMVSCVHNVHTMKSYGEIFILCSHYYVLIVHTVKSCARSSYMLIIFALCFRMSISTATVTCPFS